MKNLFKICATLVVCFFFGMVYWSSLLIEQDLKAIKKELSELKKEGGFQGDFSKIEKESVTQPLTLRPHINEKYPNLLYEDPFYQKTLPTLLGSNFIPQGTRKEAILGKPDHLHPFNHFKDIASMQMQCTGTLAQLHYGKYEIYAPFFAIKIEKRERSDIAGGFEYWVHLRDNVYWERLQPSHFPSGFPLDSHFLKRHQVTAWDYKFQYDAIMNPYVAEPKAGAMRRAYSDIESFEVIDDLTFVVRWKIEKSQDGELAIKYTSFGQTAAMQPLASFVYKYFADGKKIIEDDDDLTYQKNSIWAQNFSNHFAKNVIVSCGPYLFAGMNEEGIKFKRNPHFYDPYAVLINELHISFKESADAMWQDFKAQNIDICILSPNQLFDYQSFINSSFYKDQKSQIHEIDYVDRSYCYLGWNEKKPFFNNKKIRQAITLAVDRKRIVEQNLNHLGELLTGPFLPSSTSYDKTIPPYPFNPEESIHLLEDEGWFDKDGDGIREKIINGEKTLFRFSLLYYVKNVSTKVICEYIATALKKIGICCDLFGVDLPDLSRNFDDKSFDAIFLGWALGTPPEDPEQLWHSSLSEQKGSSNSIGFANREADEIIERLHYEYDLEKRHVLYHKFHKIIYEEAPYTFLYSPKRILLYRDHLKNIVPPKKVVVGSEMSEPDLRVSWIDL